MFTLTQAGQQKINELANNYQVSTDAVMTLLYALNNGNGTMAQFSHPELGGSGQWMQGGMTMIGDMFNNFVKNKVDGLCNELSHLLFQSTTPLFIISEPPLNQTIALQSSTQNWWPQELGMPNTAGAQNQLRYAYFAQEKRLVIERQGQVSIYDTQDHQISGVSQQQGAESSLSFTSQKGTVEISNLPLISGPGISDKANSQEKSQEESRQESQENFQKEFQQESQESTTGSQSDIFTKENLIANLPETSTEETEPALEKTVEKSPNQQEQDEYIFAKIERLAQLRERGIISKEEFTEKKAELLARL